MPFFDRFKKKEEQTPQQKEAKAAPAQKAAVEPQAKAMAKKDPSGIILNPYLSEKASMLQQDNQYVFEVFSGATKPMIRNAVSKMYGVNAQKVRIIHVGPAKVRVGRFQGTKPGFKKAIVKLAKGQKIDSLSV